MRPVSAEPNRSRAIAVRTPERSNSHATERSSHSRARFAVHGASSGTERAIRLIFQFARPSESTASGEIFGISPV
jgi:hypothetical protein